MIIVDTGCRFADTRFTLRRNSLFNASGKARPAAFAAMLIARHKVGTKLFSVIFAESFTRFAFPETFTARTDHLGRET